MEFLNEEASSVIALVATELASRKRLIPSLFSGNSRQKTETFAPIHHQGVICGVAFDRSSLRRIVGYASVVAPRRLASDAFW
jgi:hypothetical protein